MYRYQTKTNKSKMPRGVKPSEETVALLIEAEEQGFTIYTRSGDYSAYTRMCGQVHRIKQGLADLSMFDKTWRKNVILGKRRTYLNSDIARPSAREWMLGNIGYGIGKSFRTKNGELTDSELASERLYNRAVRARTCIESGRYKLSDYDKKYTCINPKIDGRTVARRGGHSFTEWMVGNTDAEGYIKYTQQSPNVSIVDKTPEQRIQARGYHRAQDAKKQIDSGKRRLSDYNPDYTLHTTERTRNGHKLPPTSVRKDAKSKKRPIRLIKTLLPEVPSWEKTIQETPEHLIFG